MKPTNEGPGVLRIKYQELQEAWDQQECTSTVSVPIPASRHFEDAFIPFHDRSKPPPERGTCPVLYVANGTVGVVHFGLATADVKLYFVTQARQAVCWSSTQPWTPPRLLNSASS